MYFDTVLSYNPQLQDKHAHKHEHDKPTKGYSYGDRYGTNPVPKFALGSKGIDPEAAYRLVHDQLSLGMIPFSYDTVQDVVTHICL